MGRKTCGVALLDPDNHILLVYENSWPARERKWGIPKGGAEARDGRDAKQTAWRECREEVGLDLDAVPHTVLKRVRRGKYTCFFVRLERRETLQLSGEIVKAAWVPLGVLQARVRARPEAYNMMVRSCVRDQ